jgi:hypothetical protein
MKTYWLHQPMPTALGFEAAALKSSMVEVAPNPSPITNKRATLDTVNTDSRLLMI